MSVTDSTVLIRNAVWGKDVRKAMADALDAVYAEATSTALAQSTLQALETSLRTQFNAEIANQTNTNPSFSEAVVARISGVTAKPYQTIGLRMDDFDNSIKTLNAEVGANTTDITNVKASVVTNTTNIANLAKVITNITKTSPRYRFDGFVPAFKDNQHMQSIVYIPEDDCILVAYKVYVGTQDMCTIIKYDRRTKAVIATYDNLELYHASDMTYNNVKKKLFISTSTDPRASNWISVFDYTTMTKTGEFQYTPKSVVYGIAWSSTLDKYVFYDDSNINICTLTSASGNFDDTVLTSTFTFNVPNQGMNYQNIEIYNNYVLIYYDVAINIYDLQGNFICMYNLSTIDEGEGMAYIGNNKFLLGRDIVNKDMATTRDTSRLYIFDITVPLTWEYDPYIMKDDKSAYDKMTVSDSIVMTAGSYKLGSTLDGADNYFPSGYNDKRSITYNSANTELVFDCSWRAFLKIDAKALVQSELSYSQDWSLANYLGNYLIQFDFYSTLGIELGFFNSGDKTDPSRVTAGKLVFRWEFYVKSLNV